MVKTNKSYCLLFSKSLAVLLDKHIQFSRTAPWICLLQSLQENSTFRPDTNMIKKTPHPQSVNRVEWIRTELEPRIPCSYSTCLGEWFLLTNNLSGTISALFHPEANTVFCSIYSVLGWSAGIGLVKCDFLHFVAPSEF